MHKNLQKYRDKKIHNHMGKFNRLNLVTGRIYKLSKNIEYVGNTIQQLGLLDVYRLLQPTTAK